ncbi:MAG: type II toxin-antitoxin system VapC family toxin [Rhodoferax sp.]|nr:type II toxin-antitoxin system VapC family toxin [Rhodoferax sp.]
MRFLLDTCVLSELVKPQPHAGVLAWIGVKNESDFFISAMTLAELQRGIVKLPQSRRRQDLSLWLGKLQLNFGKRVLPFTDNTASYWADMCSRAEARGKTMAAFDSIIAATALEHGLELVTRNVRDFASAPVILVNPWDQQTW